MYLIGSASGSLLLEDFCSLLELDFALLELDFALLDETLSLDAEVTFISELELGAELVGAASEDDAFPCASLELEVDAVASDAGA
jgi:hypothetical protein